eukprot:TRINITY_DN15903_c0_g1_i1.p1 TRINITY_DN15903_c0_g1~~TRINITY_DN15903_c0_g1_i1.p1  ORF type:complete len:276 (-),score=22.50 TRINITY_DN15903_c0_g1_i1:18-845(-)
MSIKKIELPADLPSIPIRSGILNYYNLQDRITHANTTQQTFVMSKENYNAVNGVLVQSESLAQHWFPEEMTRHQKRVAIFLLMSTFIGCGHNEYITLLVCQRCFSEYEGNDFYSWWPAVFRKIGEGIQSAHPKVPKGAVEFKGVPKIFDTGRRAEIVWHGYMFIRACYYNPDWILGTFFEMFPNMFSVLCSLFTVSFGQEKCTVGGIDFLTSEPYTPDLFPFKQPLPCHLSHMLNKIDMTGHQWLVSLIVKYIIGCKGTDIENNPFQCFFTEMSK